MAVSFLAVPGYSQLVDPLVTFNVERLPDEARAKLTILDSILTEYLRNQEWAGDDYNYDLEIDINVFFENYTGDPQEDKYKAKLLITNRHDVRLEDARWEFGLRTGEDIRVGTFHPFRSVIEFYIWMIIGMEYDRLEKLGGRTYFDRAKQIYLEASSSLYYFGWDRRVEYLRTYTAEENSAWRELQFFYDTGIYFDAQEHYPRAKDYLYYALIKLQRLTVSKQQEFLEPVHREFAEAMLRAGYEKGVRSLMAMDPEHRTVYEAILPADSAGSK